MSTAKKFSPAFFVLIAGCFFLPFFDLACLGQKLATLNGIQLVTGTHVEQRNPFNGRSEYKRIDPAPLAIAAFAAALLGLVLSFIKHYSTALINILAGSTGFGCLLVLKAQIDDEVMRQGEGLIHVQYHPGFWLILFLFLASAVYNVFVFLIEKNRASP